MSYSPELADHIRSKLIARLSNPFEQLAERPMFGYLAFLVRGKLCVAVGDIPNREIRIRIDKADYAALHTRAGAHSVHRNGRLYRGYLDLDKAALPNIDDWLEIALRFNETLH
ncbi:hypothetical protein [Neisseria chenwenguii]|uniref:Uncharacterized protein n=1 Tax=Neisseria chenwenguii TaxID=1853278 RepID=A0A220RZG4_9NEIS|nr:hypothetical protein [Neisseria chenwenguii]ASK26563.1 hypothetical protein BG910_01280 [Neisseria chenwenguii]ROV56006.1 hypothetical protein EGS38_07400 [Neisseria chenwenguii]